MYSSCEKLEINAAIRGLELHAELKGISNQIKSKIHFLQQHNRYGYAALFISAAGLSI
jgi:hypothetical protein